MRCFLRLLPVCTLFAACTAVSDVQPVNLAQPHAPTRVWARLSNGTVLAFDSATVRGDTLIGAVGGEQNRLILSDNTVLRARKPSLSRTVLLTLTGGVVAAGTWYLLEGSRGATPHPCGAMCAMYFDASGNAVPTSCYCC